MKPLTSYQVARKIGDKVYHRQYCTDCKILQQYERKKIIKKQYQEFKKTCICCKCGNDDFRVIEFHHKNSDTKIHAVSDMIKGGWSYQTIQNEINKCDAICANCHRILHWEDGKYFE